MLKKTIKFVDYAGESHEEDYYFNLTKAEVMKMQLGTAGGFAEHLQKLVDSKDVPAITKAFDNIIKASYGVKSADGRKFIKNSEVLDDFVQSEAYSELFMELLENSDSCKEFINGIMPETPKAPAAEAKK